MELQKITEEIKNMNLEVQNVSRLTITFGEHAGNILNAVEIEHRGANLALNAHYIALPFISKNIDYWGYKGDNNIYVLNPEKNIKNDFNSWCAMVGIKYMPDQFQWDDLKDCLINDLGMHNEESIKVAIKMNLKQDQPIEPFGLINRVFLTKIIVKYEALLKSANKRALEIREKLKPVQELTPEQIDIKMRADIIDIFEERKADDDRHSIKYLSYPIYEYLLKKGNLNPTTEQKLESMSMAPEILFAMKSKIMPPKELNDYKNDVNNTKNHKDLIDVAKCILVRDYFNSIEILQIEIINK